MQSSLTKQLQVLKTQDTGRKLKNNKIASLLFSPAEAANFDDDLIRSLASQGIENLIHANPHFVYLKERLFDAKYDGLNRELLTQDENNKLGEEMKAVLTELSPYFLNEDCQKVIEFLLRNFEIHSHEGSDLALIFLPFHNTVVYVRLLQNVELSKDPHWYFLEKNIREGLIIPRDLIAKQSCLDSYILENLLKLTLKNIKDHSQQLHGRKEIYLNAVKNTAHKTVLKDDCIVTFATSLATETLYFAKERKRITENLLIIIMKYVAGCLKSSHYEDAFHSGLITLSSLVLTSQFSEEYLRAILLDTVKGIQRYKDNQVISASIVGFLILVAQTQNVKFGSGLLKQLAQSKDLFIAQLEVLGRRYSLITFGLKIVQGLFGLGTAELEQNTGGILEIVEKAFNAVISYDHKMAAKIERVTLCEKLLNLMLDLYTKEQRNENELVEFSQVLRRIFPDVLTESLQKCIDRLKENEQLDEEVLKKFIESSFSTSYASYFFDTEEEAEGELSEAQENQRQNLFQGITSSKAGIRLRSVKRICKLLTNGQEMEDPSFGDFLLEMLIRRVELHDATDILNEISQASLAIHNISPLLAKKLLESYVSLLKSYLTQKRSSDVAPSVFHHNAMDYILTKWHSVRSVGGSSRHELRELLFKAIERKVFDETIIKNWKGFCDIIPCFSKLDLPSTQDLPLKTFLFEASATVEHSNLPLLLPELKLIDDVSTFSFFVNGLVAVITKAPLSSLLTKETNIFGLLRILSSRPMALRELPECTNLCKVLFNKVVEHSFGGAQDEVIEVVISCLKIELLITVMQVIEADLSFIKEILDSFGSSSAKILLYLLRTNNSKIFQINSLLFLQNELEAKGTVADLAELVMFLLTSSERSDSEARLLIFEAVEVLVQLLKKNDDESQLDQETITNYYKTKEIRAYSSTIGEPSERIKPSQTSESLQSIKGEEILSFAKHLLLFKNQFLKAAQASSTAQLLKKGETKPEDFLWIMDYYLIAVSHMSEEESLKVLAFIVQIVSISPKSKSVQKSTKNLLDGLEILANVFIEQDHQGLTTAKPFVSDFFSSLLQIYGTCGPEVQEAHLSFYVSLPSLFKDLTKHEATLHLWISTIKPETFAKLSEESRSKLLNSFLHLAERSGYYHTTQLVEQSHALSIPESLVVSTLKEAASSYIENKSELGELRKKLDFMLELLLLIQSESLECYDVVFSLLSAIVRKETEQLVQLEYTLKFLLKIVTRIASTTITSLRGKKNAENGKRLVGDAKEKTGDAKEKSKDASNISTLKSLIRAFQKRSSLEDHPTLWGILRDANLLLTWLADIDFNRASSAIVETFTLLFHKTELRTIRFQLNALNLLREVLETLTQVVNNPRLLSFSKIFLEVANIYSSQPQFRENEQISSAIRKLIEVFGPQNLTLFLNPIFSSLISEAKKGKRDPNVEKNLKFTLQLILENSKLDDNISLFCSIFQSLLGLFTYFAKQVYNLSISGVRVKTTGQVSTKALVKYMNLGTITDLKGFITLNLEFFKLTLGSKVFSQNLSTALLKGDLTKQNIFEKLQKLLGLLYDCEYVVQQTLSKSVKVKNSGENDTKDGKDTKEAKGGKDKNLSIQKKYLKRVLGLVQGHVYSLSTILPLDATIKIISSGVTSNRYELRIKSKLLQFLYDKLSATSSVKASGDFIQELVLHLTNELIEARKEKKEEAFDNDTIAYFQSIFLLFSILLKRKPKIFEKIMKDEVLEFITEQNLYLKTISIYTAALYFDKFGFKRLNFLKPLIQETQMALAIFLHSNENGQTEDNPAFAKEQITTALPELVEIVNKAKESSSKVTKKMTGYKEMCMNLVFNAISILVASLKDMLVPYAGTIMYLLAYFENQPKVERILAEFAENLEARNNIETLTTLTDLGYLLPPHYMKNIGNIMKGVCANMEKEVYDAKRNDIFKIFLHAFDFPRQYAQENNETYTVQDYKACEEVEQVWIEAYGKHSIKSNEVELRKMYSKLQNWSNTVFANEENQFSLFRKIIILKLTSHMFEILKSYFVPFMSFLLDFFVEQLNHYSSIYGEHEKKLRRHQTQDDTRVYQESTIHRLILEVLTQCFRHDKDDYIDASKFDRLTSPLVNQLDEVHMVGADYFAFINDYLTPCILELFELIRDDYKWKSFIYQILLKTRSENVKIRQATVRLIARIVEQLKERVVSLMTDLLPFMVELLEDENMQVEKESKDIVLRLEQLTGEDVKEYLRS